MELPHETQIRLSVRRRRRYQRRCNIESLENFSATGRSADGFGTIRTEAARSRVAVHGAVAPGQNQDKRGERNSLSADENSAWASYL